MRQWRTTGLAILLTAAVFPHSCRSPARGIRPVIYAFDSQAASAMRNAPLILVVRISDLRMTGDVTRVAKPPQVGGPNIPVIALYLARIRAEVLLEVQGTAPANVEFYSWIWNSGSHGGPRLFHPYPDRIRAVFLRSEDGFLHTVGDYPSYDLELNSDWVPALVSAWRAGQLNTLEPADRLVALRLRAELEGLSPRQLRDDFGDDGPRVNHHWAWGLHDLMRLAGPLFVAAQLDELCLHSRNPAARFAACFVVGQHFPGRCAAFQLALKATGDGFGAGYLNMLTESCPVWERREIRELEQGMGRYWVGRPAGPGPRQDAESLRVYATAMNPAFRQAACEFAARTPELRGLPECVGQPRAGRVRRR